MWFVFKIIAFWILALLDTTLAENAISLLPDEIQVSIEPDCYSSEDTDAVFAIITLTWEPPSVNAAMNKSK